MRQYIVNLTNHLISNNRYDEVLLKIVDRDVFVQHIKLDLETGDVFDMSPETLGRIMCSLEIGDVLVRTLNSAGFSGDRIRFNSDCEKMLRELVSLFLAVVIRDRLTGDCQGIFRWKRRTPGVPQTTKKWPPIDRGTEVRTIQPNVEKQHEWTEKGWASKKWGVRGRILRHHDSHGLYYDVRHEDGTEGCYDPSELEVISAT